MKNKCLSRELTVEMIVGTFIASVVAVLVVFTIVLSGEGFGGSEKYDVQIKFPNVMGLRQQDSVVVRGMPVGKVRALELLQDGVVVTATLGEPLVLREGYTVSVVSSSALGGHRMEIYEGPTNGAPISLTTMLQGERPENLMKEASGLISEIRGRLVNGGILNDIQEASSSISAITKRLEAGEGTIGHLLSSDGSLYNNIADISKNIREISDRVAAGEGTLGKLLSKDEALYKDLSEGIANIRSITGRMNAGEGTLGRLLSADDEFYDDVTSLAKSLKNVAGRIERGEGTLGALLAKESTVYDDLKDTITNLKAVTARIANGEGLLGQLLAEDARLQGEVEGLVGDVRATVDDYRESSPVVNFTSIFFGAF